MTFGDRLKGQRQNKGLFQKDVASFLGIDRTTYVKYENDGSEPDKHTIAKLAEYFSVSTDYLLGLTGDPAPCGAPPQPDPDTIKLTGLSERDKQEIRHLVEYKRNALADDFIGGRPKSDERIP